MRRCAMQKLVAAALLAVAACGGGSKSSTGKTPEQPPPSTSASACVGASKHMSEMAMKAGAEEQMDAETLAELGPVIERVFGDSCKTDAWTPEVIACINAADDKTMDPCIEMLTPEQQKALETDMEREIAPLLKEESAESEPPATSE